MKGNFWKKLLTFMSCIVATLGLMCFVSCAADAGSDSDDNNTDKLVLDFNGGTMHGHKTVEFTMEDITPHVGKAIDEAFKCLGLDTAFIKKEGFYLHGWTLKKNGETCVTNLPTFGTLYAKWGTDPLPKDEDVPLTLTLDFNGGKLDGASFKYFDNSKVAKYAGKTIDEALECLGITTITKENYELVGWTDNLTTANEVTTLPTKGNVTLYAIWQFNGTANPLTLTLDFNGGTSGEESYFVLTDDLIADYKGMPIAIYFTEKNKPLPTKKGYTLIGWSTTKNGEVTIVDIPLEGTVKYYAVWEEVVPEKLTFTLDAGKGLIALDAYNEDSEKVKTISTEFEAGATLEEVFLSLPSVMPVFESLPDNDDAYCYEEKGVYYYPYAYSDRKGSVVKLGVNTEIPDITLTKDTTFYIEYRKCVNVLFNVNGGYRELEEEKSSENFTMSMGFYFSMLWSSVGDNLKIKRDGYVLEGFTYTKDGSDFATEIPLDDCTLYAKWAVPKECTLTLKSEPYSTFIDKNGKSLGSELKITYTTGLTLGQILEQNNMDLDSFIDESELKYKSYIEFVGFVAEDILYYESSVLTKDLILSVKTQPIQLWVRFDYNEGTDNNGKTSFDKVVLGEDIQTKISTQSIASIIEEYNVPTPTKEGYKLVGWGYDTETPIDVIDKTVEELLSEKAYLDLYAVWQEKDEPTDPEPEKLTFTWDAGEGFFYDYVKDEFIKTISVEFDAGATANEIQELLMEKHMDHINPMYCFEEDGIEYSYKEDGIYYILEEIKDDKGNVIMNVWTNTGTGMSPNQKIYEDITYYFSYVKVVKITYKLEDGYVIEYDHESDKEIKITEDIKGFGVEGYKEFSVNDPERDGYVFMGWTLTKDGDDFVTKVPSEEITVYAKWELPKECVLTINAGEYSQLFDRDGNSLGREVNLTFTSGMTLEGVLSNNNIDFDCMVNEFEIPDTTFEGLKDSEGNEYSYNIANHISDKKLVDSITLYPFYQRIEISGNVGILKYYDYVNDYGNYDEKAEPKYEKKYDKDIFEECLNTPHADGYIFAGWTYTPNGNDYVNLDDYIPAGVTTTVYAKWIPESEVKPLYEYSSDNSQITFTFVPSYFGYDWDSDEFHEVQLMSEAVGWDPKEKRLMEKDSDGNYTVTVPYNAAAYKLYEKWSGFKFYVFEDEEYLGPTQCKISSYDVINMGDPNFNLKLATSNLTIDLNGGNIEGDTSSLEYEVDGYIGTSMNGFIEGFKGVTVKDGYVFAGWTLTEDGDDYVDYVPGGINTIYAKWVVPSTQTITLIAREGDNFYNLNKEPLGNEVSFEFEVGITFEELLSNHDLSYSSMLQGIMTENEHIAFNNFVDADGNVYNSLKILSSSVILTATYIKYAMITFDTNGGAFADGEEKILGVNYESNQYYLDWYEKPTKEGYKFIGWTLTKDGDDFINDITGPIPNGIVYAKWQDPLKLFDNGDLIGDFAVIESELKDGTIAWVYDDTHGLNLTYEGEGLYSATFTYYDYMCGWDQDTDYCDFKIRAVAGSWQGASYGVANYLDQPELDGDEVLCGSNNAPNVRIPAEDGVTYKVTFRCASDGNVYVKVATVK